MMHALVWGSIGFAITMLAAVVFERTAAGLSQLRRTRLERRYRPLLDQALAGDDQATKELAALPSRHRLIVALLLIQPLVEDRTSARIAAARRVARTVLPKSRVERYLRSRRWWRRALALRGVGLIQDRRYTPAIVAALDDRHPGVRAAALDALADLHDPAAMQAIVVRLLDVSLHRGRRAAALDAFGADAEAFVLAVADVHPDYRVNYARALAICGTARARPILRAWLVDERAEVRVAALSALARTGLDDETARAALGALEHEDPRVRASAARAFEGWRGPVDASEPLARRLEDAWSVAVPAARSLKSMGDAGLARLHARASLPGLAGLLARQMLWEAQTGTTT